MFYAVMAYRWGWTNNSQYFVWGGEDRESAIAWAKAEPHERGGKYGCTVYEIDGERCEPIFHAPSSYDEDKAHLNSRIMLFERIGSHVVSECEEGRSVKLKDLRELIGREKQIADILTKTTNENVDAGR